MDKLLEKDELDTLKDFVEKNISSVYLYINTVILKDIGKMNYEFFLETVQNIFDVDTKCTIYTKQANPNIFVYFIFTALQNYGKMDYTSLRIDTIDFAKLNKESLVYYNYVQFFMDDSFLYIKLMQTKIGGMPIDNDIIKFTKKVPIVESGLENFISKNLN